MGGSPGVRVFVRLRPPPREFEQEAATEACDVFSVQPRVVTISDQSSSSKCQKAFEFSRVFSSEDTQAKVFAAIADPLVEAALSGRGGCVVAYGQTGSGKTFSIFGEGSGERCGLLPRFLDRLFQCWGRIDNCPSVTVSFLELHLDEIHDLGRGGAASGVTSQVGIEPENETSERRRHAPNERRRGGAVAVTKVRSCSASHGSAGSVFSTHDESAEQLRVGGSVRSSSDLDASNDRHGEYDRRFSAQPQNLEVHEVTNGSVEVRGLARFPVRCSGDARKIVARGLSRRVASTRSHVIFSVYLPPVGNGVDRCGLDIDLSTLNPAGRTVAFVDLAGSERFARSTADSSPSTEEITIMSSFTALGKVVSALSSGAAHQAPYGDSELTKILSPTLSKNDYVAILATLHPSKSEYAESHSTLVFADLCKTAIAQPYSNNVSAAEKQQSQRGARTEQADGTRTFPSECRRVATAASDFQSHDGLSGDVAESRRMSEPTLASPVDVREANKVRSRQSAQLQEEKTRRSRAEYQTEQHFTSLEKEKRMIDSRNQSRTLEFRDIEEKRESLQTALHKLDAELRGAAEKANLAQSQSLGELQKDAERRLHDIDNMLLRIPADLQEARAANEWHLHEQENERLTLSTRHQNAAQELQRSCASQLEQVDQQWSSYLAEKDRHAKQLADTFADCRKREDRVIEESQEELASLFENARRLSKILADVEDGLYPVVHGNGLKVAVLPQGEKPSLPNRHTHPHLFAALEAASQNAVKSVPERCGRRPSSARPPRLVDLEPTVVRHGPKRDEGHPAEAKVVRDAVHCSVGSIERVARGVCLAKDDAEAELLVADLDAEQLRSVCMNLRAKALETFSPADEREKFRQASLAGLEDRATVRYLQELERRRDDERTLYIEAQARSQQMQKVLESIKRSLCPPRTTSSLALFGSTTIPRHRASGEFSSRTTMPDTRIGSRLSSRPTTASLSRPPTATSRNPK